MPITMYLRLILFLFLLISLNHINGQTCYPNGISFSTQNEEDLFRLVNPGCKVIGGDVSFSSGDITNLDSLIGVEVILGELNVSTNNMTNFEGLNNLDTISEGISINATNLNDFTGLESLKQIGVDDESSIAYSSINSNIEDFTGLDSLQKMVRLHR